MWPWEHVAVGYIAYSLLSRTPVTRRPGRRELLAVVLGALGPDLIDKPLSWGFRVFADGYSMGHSVLFAVPLAIAAVAVGARVGERAAGIAFGVGYLSHLPADVFYPMVFGREPAYSVLVWPFGPSSRPAMEGLFENFFHYFAAFLDFVTGPEAALYVSVEVLLLLMALFLLWRDLGARRRSRPTTEPNR